MWGIYRHQNFVHRYVQQRTQSVEVVNRGKALTPLPLVDGLGLPEAEAALKVPDGKPVFPAQPDDDRRSCQGHGDRFQPGRSGSKKGPEMASRSLYL